MEAQHFWYLQLLQVSGGDVKPRPNADWESTFHLYQKCISSGFRSEHALSSPLLIEILLEVGYDPSVDRSQVLITACERGLIDVVRILLRDGRCNPATHNNYPIALAYSGGVELVQLLLDDKRVDPSDCDNRAIKLAASWAPLEVVKLLLRDKRVDPRAEQDDALSRARYLGREDIVKLLKEHSKSTLEE